MAVSPAVVPEDDLLDPVSSRSALPDVAHYQRRYTFYNAEHYLTRNDETLRTTLQGASLDARLLISTAPAEYCLPVKKDRRFSPVFQVKVCMVADQPREVDCTLCAYPLSTQERGTLERGTSGEPPQLPEPLRDLVVDGTPPQFVDKHTYFRGPCHTARRSVKLPAGKEVEAVLPFEGLEFVKPSSMSPMTIVFAARFGDGADVALALLTPATICVCRADQRADAATKLGYSSSVFDRVNDCNGPTKYKTVFNPPTRGCGGGGGGRSRGAAVAVPAPAGPPRHTAPQRSAESPSTALSTSPPQPFVAHSSAARSGGAAHGSRCHASPWPPEPPRAAATNGRTPSRGYLPPPRRDLHPVPPPGPPLGPPRGEKLTTERRVQRPVAAQRMPTAAAHGWHSAASGPPAEHSSAHGIAPRAPGISSPDGFDSISRPRYSDDTLMQSLHDLLAEPQAELSANAESAFAHSQLQGAFCGVYAEEWWQDGSRSFGAASSGAYDAGPVGGAAYAAHPPGASNTLDADFGGGPAAQWTDAAFTPGHLAHLPPSPARPAPAAEEAVSEAAAVAAQAERDALAADVGRGALDGGGPLRGMHPHSALPRDEAPPAGDGGKNRSGVYVPHLRRPECWPVPTAMALGSSAPAQLPQPQPQQPPAPMPARCSETQRDVSMAEEYDDWYNRVDTEVDIAPHSAFTDAGLMPGIFAMAGDYLLADNRDRDDEGEFPLHSVYIPEPHVAVPPERLRGPPMQPGPHNRDTTFDQDARFLRTRDRSPPRDPGRAFALSPPPGRGPGCADDWHGPSPGFGPDFPHGELDVERLLEPPGAPVAGPEGALDAPFNNVGAFSLRAFPPQPPQAPQPLAEPSGFHAEFEDAVLGVLGATTAEDVGFGTVQAPGMFEGVRPDTTAHNLLDLLQVRNGGVSAGGRPPSPAALPAVEAVAHPSPFPSQEIQIEDPLETFSMGDWQDFLFDDTDDFKFTMPMS